MIKIQALLRGLVLLFNLYTFSNSLIGTFSQSEGLGYNLGVLLGVLITVPWLINNAVQAYTAFTKGSNRRIPYITFISGLTGSIGSIAIGFGLIYVGVANEFDWLGLLFMFLFVGLLGYLAVLDFKLVVNRNKNVK